MATRTVRLDAASDRPADAVAAPVARASRGRAGDADTEPIRVVDAPMREPIAFAQPTGHGDAPDSESRSNGSRSPDGVTARELRQVGRSRRRYERGEVKRFTRRARRRRMVWLVSVGGVVLVLGGAVLAAYSPLMTLHSIDVVGTTRLKSAAIVKALDGQLGKPLPLIDFGSIKKELGTFSLIRSYSTETHPPGTLIVRIVERAPVGLLKTGNGYDLVDPAGVVIATTAQRPAGYPVIQLAGTAKSAAAAPGFTAATAVLSVLPASVLPQVDSISAKTTDDVALTLIDGKTVLWGGPDQSDLKAADLAALLKDAPSASVYDVSAPQSPVTK